MKVIKATQQMLETRTLVLGFQGENLRTQLRIDCAATFAEYPNATPALAIKPPSGATYPVFVERDGNEVVWDIVANNLTLKGDGELQLTFYKDSVIAKTAIGHITVNRSLQIDGEMPDVVATWIENANRKLAEVDAQIVELEGMVDTATDAATRAEQSESNATTAAANAATSAATASTKAAEAQASANTATAKASEAALSATQARNSAMSAANSESGATAKAVEAAQSAQTAAQKAEQITEAAQIATGKAEEASASATAAHASATDAASSATAASASETAAKASETAAGASATQAAQSAQTASTAAQTATQKAAEAAQSATNAAASATSAATSAETASTKAGEAAQSAQAVAETAEQLADSLEQIDQNTQDIAELDERKANIDGYYPDMTVGNAEQLNSSKYVENSEPYTLRTSGGTSDIGNREYLDAVVGGTVAWNQMVRDSASENSTDFAPIVTVTDAVEDAAGVKVKIEPVQDLHGYDHPWPAGGGKNKFETTAESKTESGVTWTVNEDGSVSVSGTAENYTAMVLGTARVDSNWGTVTISGISTATNIVWGRIALKDDNDADVYLVTGGSTNPTISVDLSQYPTATKVYIVIKRNNNDAVSGIVKPMVEIGSTASEWTPYSNICPITGWDGVKVTRTGKNLLDESTIIHGYYFPNDVNDIAQNEAYRTVKLVLLAGQYTFSTTLSNAVLLRAWFDGINHNYTETEQSKTITTTTDGIVAFCFRNTSTSEITESFTTQIERGPATAYEPYAGQTYSITLPTEAGTVYGGELTVNADGSGSLVVDRAMLTLDGNNLQAPANWRDTDVADGRDSFGVYWYWTYTGIAGSPLPDVSGSFTKAIATNLKNNGSNGLYKRDEKYAFALALPHQPYLAIRLPAEALSDTSSGSAVSLSVLEWLQNNPVTICYPIATPITYTLTPTEIRTLLGTNNVWADTGDVALTYTGTDEHLTLESGKKYLSRISGTDSMLLGSGQEITAAKGTDNVFDLTRMFGTAVADYVYGQGAAFFRKWFPNAVYPYNSGELKHVEGLQSHDMVGFNAWDGEWVQGYWDKDTGVIVSSYNWKACKNFIPIIPNTAYYFKREASLTASGGYCIFYDADKNYLTYFGTPKNASFTTPANAYYMTFYMSNSYFDYPICVNLSHNGSRNGEYEPYEKHSYPLDSTVVLRGIPKVGANGVYWDGDRYLPDGTVERRYGVVDLGTVNWLYRNSLFDGSLPNGKLTSTRDGGILAVCSKYTVFPLHWSSLTDGQACVGGGYVNSSTCSIVVKDSAYTDSAAFKAAMSGVYLVYELATPTTESAQPYHSTQWVSDWGTEEFVSTGIVPVGHETRYPANLRDKLQHLPDAASGNGSYLITQTDGQMVLTPFPAPPSTAGNYVLKATVTGGVATYTWEVAT